MHALHISEIYRPRTIFLPLTVVSRYARTVLSRFVVDPLFKIRLPRVQVSFNAIRY